MCRLLPTYLGKCWGFSNADPIKFTVAIHKRCQQIIMNSSANKVTSVGQSGTATVAAYITCEGYQPDTVRLHIGRGQAAAIFQDKPPVAIAYL